MSRCGAVVDQERHAAVGFRPHQLDSAFGFGPIRDHNVLQFLMQECFARLFPGRIDDFDEIRQHARGFESRDLAVLDGCE